MAGAIFLALLLGAILIIRPMASPEQTAETNAEPAPPPSIPSPPPALNRADLISAADLVAEAAATGTALPEQSATLAGRRFVLLMPFGCNLPANEQPDRWASWSYDRAQQTLRANVMSQSWSADERVRAMTRPLDYEAAEGFWIPRPWIRGDSCPRAPDEVSSGGDEAEGNAASLSQADVRERVTADRETLALVEFFAAGSPRAARRNGRPYTLSVRIAPEEIDLSQGLRLKIEGRLVALADGRPIACRTQSSETRPICLINADIGRVAITDASGERTLAEWSD